MLALPSCTSHVCHFVPLGLALLSNVDDPKPVRSQRTKPKTDVVTANLSINSAAAFESMLPSISHTKKCDEESAVMDTEVGRINETLVKTMQPVTHGKGDSGGPGTVGIPATGLSENAVELDEASRFTRDFQMILNLKRRPKGRPRSIKTIKKRKCLECSAGAEGKNANFIADNSGRDGNSSITFMKAGGTVPCEQDSHKIQQRETCCKCQLFVGAYNVVGCFHHAFCFQCLNEENNKSLLEVRDAKCMACKSGPEL